MDYKKYSEKLEEIIGAIPMPEHTYILIKGLLDAAKKECSNEGFNAMQSGKPA